MTVKIGVNGLGRVGRAFVRHVVGDSDLEIVAVNDLADASTITRLLRSDSTFGPFGRDVSLESDTLIIDGAKIAVTSIAVPAEMDWGAHGIEIVVECTGKFRTREAAAAHLEVGASKVIISAPGKGVDATIVMGVNEHIYDPAAHHVISNASCTTNCVAPMVKVLDDAFGFDRGFMTTVHAYTSDQNLLDGPHKDARRARAAAVNIIPTTTGAAKAVGEVLPHLAGRLDGLALRVPVVDGSLVDLAALLNRRCHGRRDQRRIRVCRARGTPCRRPSLLRRRDRVERHCWLALRLRLRLRADAGRWSFRQGVRLVRQ
jgi:glyceraldehyde 3-phosphate dehydrogenase